MNKLSTEKSPYLLQHAENPVDWYPWGEEAFEKARNEDKPIFLSIGYSTCHWCHVMAHESFEDKEVADLINDTFISIKVDREERPDIDKIYMTVCQIMTNSGGWPLTILMTSDKKPFFAGTYFPKITRFGRIGLMDLIKRVKGLWENNMNELLDSSKKITFALQDLAVEAPGRSLDEKVLKQTLSQLSMRFDAKHGGFGSAPKFPTPHNLLFLLRMYRRTGNKTALEMVEKSLRGMRNGGIYDQIGYGFHRYSTDAEWLVPHFEKMLYDNALLAMVYIEAFQVSGNLYYKKTAHEIFEYILRDMTSPEGGFYSAEDADSEGVEGKFYVWNTKEIVDLLEPRDSEIFLKVFNVKDEGNYLEEATRKKTGKNILHLKKPLKELSQDLNIDENSLELRIDHMRSVLFNARKSRIRPHLDDKILTDWNGLMIAALAKGGFVFQDEKLINTAKKALNFIMNTLRDNNGRLLHRYRDGNADINAFLDDYAFLIWGILELYEATFDTNFLKTAIAMNDEMIKYFWDSYIGGFFFTAEDNEELLTRQKEIYDGAIPSGNSVAMFNLLRISQLTGDQTLEEKADFISRVFAENVRTTPVAHSFLMIAVDFGIGPTYSLVISGDKNQQDTEKLINSIRDTYLPNKTLIFRPTDNENPPIDQLADFVKYFDKYDDKATAYVCINKTCKPPTNDVSRMVELLNPERIL